MSHKNNYRYREIVFSIVRGLILFRGNCKYESERMVNFQLQKYVGHVEELSKNAGIIIIGNIKHGY